ncbi:hypothetical protein [Roseivivax sp. CAU 1761]
MRAIHWALLPVLALAACAETGGRVPFNGEYYRSRVSAPALDKASFSVSTGPVSRGVEGARKALHYEATRHCVAHLGTSDIAWSAEPLTAPLSALSREGGRLASSGLCLEAPRPGM